MSQPFGICSHGQYFPKFVAQIFLYEMKQILNNVRHRRFYADTDPHFILPNRTIKSPIQI